MLPKQPAVLLRGHRQRLAERDTEAEVNQHRCDVPSRLPRPRRRDRHGVRLTRRARAERRSERRPLADSDGAARRARVEQGSAAQWTPQRGPKEARQQRLPSLSAAARPPPVGLVAGGGGLSTRPPLVRNRQKSRRRRLRSSNAQPSESRTDCTADPDPGPDPGRHRSMTRTRSTRERERKRDRERERERERETDRQTEGR